MLDPGTTISHLANTLWLVLLISLPALLVATVVGLIVGLGQAITQIQDQTLPQTMKIIAVIGVIAFFGFSLAQPLIRHTEQILRDFPALTRLPPR